jgi:hypothetical protein
MKRFSAGLTISYSTYRMELNGSNAPQLRCFHVQVLEEVAVSESSSIQKSILHGWVDAGVWLDFILVGMVVGSAVGLAYTLLMH